MSGIPQARPKPLSGATLNSQDQGQNAAPRAVTPADLGELHLCRLAAEASDAERLPPRSRTNEIEPAAIGMDASLQRFNLVRIERHFTLPW